MNTAMEERFIEAQTVALVQAKLLALSHAVTSPVSKVYKRQKGERAASWQELAALCAGQAMRLQPTSCQESCQAPRITPSDESAAAG